MSHDRSDRNGRIVRLLATLAPSLEGGNLCHLQGHVFALALVKVDAADVAKVNPSIPFWGGPVALNTTSTAAGDTVYSYGNSSLRAGITPLSPKIGISLGDNAADGGWSHPLYTLTPGVPGDSGSAFVDGQGRAVGTLSTLGLLPLPLSNNIGDLSRELAYAQAHSGIAGLQLTNGTEPFRGAL